MPAEMGTSRSPLCSGVACTDLDFDLIFNVGNWFRTLREYVKASVQGPVVLAFPLTFLRGRRCFLKGRTLRYPDKHVSSLRFGMGEGGIECHLQG